MKPKPCNDLHFRTLGGILPGTDRSPLIHEAHVVRGERMRVSVDFRIDGLHPFWPRLKLAFRYWWLIASGKLECAVLAKVK